MCDHPNREEAMTVIRRNDEGVPTVWCDPCIAPLVEALQPIGTVASCCGHGRRPGTVSLRSGQEILVMDYREARQLDGLWPDADLASLGYVRLNGIDVEALRSALSEFDGPWGAQEWATRRVATAMRQVLAAIDQEDADAT